MQVIGQEGWLVALVALLLLAKPSQVPWLSQVPPLGPPRAPCTRGSGYSPEIRGHHPTVVIPRGHCLELYLGDRLYEKSFRDHHLERLVGVDDDLALLLVRPSDHQHVVQAG